MPEVEPHEYEDSLKQEVNPVLMAQIDQQLPSRFCSNNVPTTHHTNNNSHHTAQFQPFNEGEESNLNSQLVTYEAPSPAEPQKSDQMIRNVPIMNDFILRQRLVISDDCIKNVYAHTGYSETDPDQSSY